MVDSRDSISDRLNSVEVDTIAGLLDGPRARRAFLLRCTMDPPWALRIEDEAPLSVVAMLHGLAMKVIAEGVVEAVDAAALWDIGVDAITGPWASRERVDLVSEVPAGFSPPAA